MFVYFDYDSNGRLFFYWLLCFRDIIMLFNYIVSFQLLFVAFK